MSKLRAWTKPITETPLVGTVADVTRSRRDLIVENALLRQQLLVLQRQVKRPKLSWRDRVVIIGLASRVATWKQALLIVRPETVLRWHRELFRWVWRRKSQPKPTIGRPRLPKEQIAVIRRIANENLTWGAERIRGELLKLGLPVAKSTIQRYLKGRRAAGPGSQTWRTFWLCCKNRKGWLRLSGAIKIKRWKHGRNQPVQVASFRRRPHRVVRALVSALQPELPRSGRNDD